MLNGAGQRKCPVDALFGAAKAMKNLETMCNYELHRSVEFVQALFQPDDTICFVAIKNATGCPPETTTDGLITFA